MSIEVEQSLRGENISETDNPKASVDVPAKGAFSVNDMCTPEHFLLISVRHWVNSVKQKHSPIPRLARAFNIAQISAGLRPLDAFMLLTATTAIRALDIRCPKCASIGAGEIDVLSTVAFIQAQKSEWAYQRLLGWLPPASARRALADVEALALEMATVELRIPLRLEYVGLDLANVSDDRNAVVTFPIHKTVQ